MLQTRTHKQCQKLSIWTVKERRKIGAKGCQKDSSRSGINMELKQQWQQQWHLKLNIWERVPILWLLLHPHIIYCWQCMLQMDCMAEVQLTMWDYRFKYCSSPEFFRFCDAIIAFINCNHHSYLQLTKASLNGGWVLQASWSFHYWQPAPWWDCYHGWQILATQPWAPTQKGRRAPVTLI